MKTQTVGVDIGAEMVKVVVLSPHDLGPQVEARLSAPHHKDPHGALRSLLEQVDLAHARGLAATGRLSRVLRAAPVPTKAALRKGIRLAHPEFEAVTVVSIGAHGFSVLELGEGGDEWYQQNSRCSQGTGNFLAQLVNRFGLTVEEASELCNEVTDPAPLSGRCPVILKTDMTHLANKGEDRARILAGLYDAVTENVLTLLRPKLAPRDVILTGGVCRSARIRRNLSAWLEARGMRLVRERAGDQFLEALGAASHALEHPCELPEPSRLFATSVGSKLEEVPSLRTALSQVERKPTLAITTDWSAPHDVYLGLDIGSTGSKCVAIDTRSGDVLWESYLNTEGAPVTAAQRLMERWVAETKDHGRVVGVGVTGSGREVVGSLFRTCYGSLRVFVMNEIAAHARGAVSIDPDVDTIFEIGGQDAKYIRLDGGRVIDAAMNEACSAGTGSFIAEQGTKFDGVGDDVRLLGTLALEASHGISLGQHCSVFMAEVIDEAITQGAPRDAIIAGLYDSVIRNYLNRVKGPRSVGKRVFCQGMPFASDALAAAVARQTGRGVVVPPNPGTIGALGIALLSRDEQRVGDAPLDIRAFLSATITSKETFVCPSTKGCGGSGNKCRIDRLKTVVNDVEQKFLWGGNCSLYDRGAGRTKLPDRAPDPFAERDALVDGALDEAPREPLRGVVGVTDEFALKGLFPLFVAFLKRLGYRCDVLRHARASTLRKGIEGARVPYCAPMQLYHGAMFELAERKPDYVLVPMLLELPRVAHENASVLCPVVQSGPDLVGSLIESQYGVRVLRPVVQFGTDGYDGAIFRAAMKTLADELGVGDRLDEALRHAIAVQRRFEAKCLDVGAQALAFCRREGVVPVAVLGRPYTIHNDVLNSNVPSILRTLGAMAIPGECLPVPADTPIYEDQFWAYTQRNLRVADYVRKTDGLYSVFCSNYACGPDSFTLHFYNYVMQGKPCTVVETDGHSGDAGTKTRMEAFLYCVDTDRRNKGKDPGRNDLVRIERARVSLIGARAADATLLIPRMGPAADVAGASLRAEGLRVEVLPMATRDDVATGRRYTSGKECIPMMLTLGAMLNRLERERDTRERFVLVMPSARGPCRFGVYNTLHKIVLEQTGWSDRVSTFSPDDGDYFRDTSPEFEVRIWVGFCGHDLLQGMLFDVRPVERKKGVANAIFERYRSELLTCLERPAKGTATSAVKELFFGMFGVRDILTRAAKEFAAAKNPRKEVPTVAVVGEIYVRLDPFANDFVTDKLEARGLRVRMAPFVEWLEYTTVLAEKRLTDRMLRDDDSPIGIALSGLVQRTTMQTLYDICARPLGWGRRPTVDDALRASLPYVDRELAGEACLTVGGPIHEYREGLVHGVVIVGPHECMPCKISEAQYGRASEEMGIPYLSLSLNGDPLDTEPLDRFAYDIHESFRNGHGRAVEHHTATAAIGEHGRSVDPSIVPLRLGRGRGPAPQRPRAD